MTEQEKQARIAEIRAKREAMGASHPLNRLRAYCAKQEPITAKDE